MPSELRSEAQGAASLRLITSPWALPEPANSALRLRAVVAKGIAGKLSGVLDLICLSATLIYLALWAVSARPAVAPWTLLSMRMSVAHFCMVAVCWTIWRSLFFYCGLYTWQHLQSAFGVVCRVLLATGMCALVEAEVIAFQWHHGHYLRVALYAWIAAAFGTLLSRVAIGCFQIYLRPHLRRTRSAVIVGGGTSAVRVCDELHAHDDWKYSILGVVDSAPASLSEHSLPILGRIGNLEEILMRQVVDEVIVTLPLKSHYGAVERVIAICERVGVQVQYAEELFDVSWSSHCHPAVQEHRNVVLKMVHEDYRHGIKRAIDIAGALFGLIVCAPLLLVVAILIKCSSKGPVLFGQERYGLGKRTFRIYKFRTMVENAEAAQAALEHMNQNSGPVFKIFEDPRITRLGAFLRKTSIDELPQLINVVKGEMSLVGPRPLNLRDVSRFSEAWLMRRFSVKPGLTCLWQISGRSTVSFDRWIALDLHYIDNWSLLLDFRIIALTFPAVIKGTGAA
ncbi:MAG TPA: sugar transferase [Terracidiphilus sp.]|nr:sugar transferase [Terracidiphilus sp.]